MSKQNIIFYFPYKEIGGVSVLFLRMANELKQKYTVYIVDYSDGYMGSRIPEGVKFIDFEKVEAYPENSILVVQSANPWTFSDIKKFHPDTRVFFWNLHPNNFFPYIYSNLSSMKIKRIFSWLLRPLSYLRIKKIKKTINYLSKNKSLVFMDSENYNKTSAFFPSIKIQKKILPIMSESSEVVNIHGDLDPLRCCWIGRITDFKVYILEHLLQRLNNITGMICKINFTIVGQGEQLDWLKEKVRDLNRIKIEYIDEISSNQLDDYLIEHVDVLFAMGTSALEGACRHIPTFLLNYSYKPLKKNYSFNYLYESNDLSLGSLINQSMYEIESTLEKKLLEIIENYPVVSQKCYEYWENNYSPQVVIEKFENFVNLSEANIKEMNSLGFFRVDILSLIFKKIRLLFLSDISPSGFKQL